MKIIVLSTSCFWPNQWQIHLWCPDQLNLQQCYHSIVVWNEINILRPRTCQCSFCLLHSTPEAQPLLAPTLIFNLPTIIWFDIACSLRPIHCTVIPLSYHSSVILSIYDTRVRVRAQARMFDCMRVHSSLDWKAQSTWHKWSNNCTTNCGFSGTIGW